MTAGLGRILLYTRHIPEMIAFYGAHFGYREVQRDGDRIIALTPTGTGVPLLLHPAAKGQRQGQAQVKLVFDVRDVPGFAANAAARGLTFGPLQDGGGYAFANTKDPSGNSVQISSRAFLETR